MPLQIPIGTPKNQSHISLLSNNTCGRSLEPLVSPIFSISFRSDREAAKINEPQVAHQFLKWKSFVDERIFQFSTSASYYNLLSSSKTKYYNDAIPFQDDCTSIAYIFIQCHAQYLGQQNHRDTNHYRIEMIYGNRFRQ